MLNRTVATHYTYACNASNYNAGRYSMCEVGDLSGKNGLLQPTTTDGLTFQLPVFVDNLPAYAVNYNSADVHARAKRIRFIYIKLIRFGSGQCSQCLSKGFGIPNELAASGRPAALLTHNL